MQSHPDGTSPRGLQAEVKVRRRFQRAIRLDTDLDDASALQGFVCPASFAQALTGMAQQIRETGHGAFTWTGPFGSGKSSLAVVLAALIGRSPHHRQRASTLLGDTGARIATMLEPGKWGYHTLGIVGRKQDCAQLLAEALRRERLIRRPIDPLQDGGAALVEAIQRVSQRPKRAGLVILVDEMGKILEAAAQGHGDLHFLQQLAECASRSQGRLIIIGILHQSFAEYTGRLAQRTRDEWMKVQGRFIDIPLAAAANEQLALLAEAIEAKPPQGECAAAELASVINRHRPVVDRDLEQHLIGCWPLNPVTASLLGPFSRRRFGQNQRSLFSFLNSAEPWGFQEFLAGANQTQTYTPAMFWNYLQANLAPSILASPDGHRWSTAEDALERCVAKIGGGGGRIHLWIAQTIAVIDQFREQAGFYPSRDVLRIATPHISSEDLDQALDDLVAWSIIVYRRHLGAYAIFAGSDFDIEAAIEEERRQRIVLDYSSLQRLANLQPVVAKRHYHQTGTLRWLDVEVIPVSEVPARVQAYQPAPGSLGTFLLALPDDDVAGTAARDMLQQASQHCMPGATITAGLVPNSEMLVDWAEELVALDLVRTHRVELSGDAVARREINARFETLQLQLGNALYRAFVSMVWFSQGKEYELVGLAAIHRYTSRLADEAFPQAPWIRNELLNRAKPSSNAMAARRHLMYAMVNATGQPRLGIEGYPAEGGLYQSLLVTTGLYRGDGDIRPTPAFMAPLDEDPCRLGPIWEAADAMLETATDKPLGVKAIYQLWQDPPFGLKEGLLPVLILAYVLSRRDRIAVYLDGMFQPDMDDFLVDRLQQEPDSVQIRQVDLGDFSRQILAGVDDLVSAYGEPATGHRDALGIARRLVAIVMALPPWTMRTQTLSEDARKLRTLIRSASDPNRLLFDDLPAWAEVGIAHVTELDIQIVVSSVRQGLTELVQAYPAMLERLRTLLLAELGADTTGIRLAERARNVLDLTGDFRLDAFAARLANYGGTEEDMEGIASLAVNKPPRTWVDRDLDAAQVEIANLAQQFNRSEAFARVKGRADTRHAIAFVAGFGGSPHTMMKEFDIDLEEASLAGHLARQISLVLEGSSAKGNVALAALAQVGTSLLHADAESHALQPVATGIKEGQE